jgi:hypothetical protein
LLFVDDTVIIIIGKDFFETHEKLRNIMNRAGGIFEWAKDHNCEFSIEKFQLLDIMQRLTPHPLNPKRRIPTPRRTLILGNQCIPSKETAKFLGIIVDNKLNWKGQCAAAIAKGQDWLIQFGWLARASRGINAKYIQQLYLSIAVPQMLYAADIFLTPRQNIGKATKDGRVKQAAITKLASVQRRAALMITGVMKTTATDVAEVMANLIPFSLLVDKYRQRAAIRLATLPPTHPLHKPVVNMAKRLVKHHPTPLHDLMHRYKIQPQNMETIKAVRFDTRWTPKVAIRITNDKDEAIANVNQDSLDVKVFTDGSGMKGKIGAAAVLYRYGRAKTELRYKLGMQ